MKSLLTALAGGLGGAFLTIGLGSARLASLERDQRAETRALVDRVDELAKRQARPPAVSEPVRCGSDIPATKELVDALAARVVALLDARAPRPVASTSPGQPADESAGKPPHHPADPEVAVALEQAQALIDQVLTSGRLDHDSFMQLHAAFARAESDSEDVRLMRQRLIVAVNTGVLVPAVPFEVVP